MKISAFIPARYEATRFPGKLMQLLGDKPVIRHTYDNTLATGIFDEVVVVTDSEIIYKEITGNGGIAVMSNRKHESGSDRIAEAIESMQTGVIVNVQGDEPFVNREPLESLVRAFKDPDVKVASLMRRITNERAKDPNLVKVVTDKNGDALYFSRSMIPFPREGNSPIPYWLHIGIYAYTREALISFVKWPHSPLELTEKLEQLRFLENGIKIRMVETTLQNISIDTPEDLERAAEALRQRQM